MAALLVKLTVDVCISPLCLQSQDIWFIYDVPLDVSAILLIDSLQVWLFVVLSRVTRISMLPERRGILHSWHHESLLSNRQRSASGIQTIFLLEPTFQAVFNY
jgi:hypothetical protein